MSIDQGRLRFDQPIADLLADAGVLVPVAPEFLRIPCDSGTLTLYRSHGRQPPISMVARLLATACPMYVLFHFSKAGLDLPDELEKPEYFFDGLPPEIIGELSPVFLSPNEFPDVFAWMDEAWGKDALVTFYTHRDRGSLLQHLRLAARVKSENGDPEAGEQVLGLGTPSVFRALLQYRLADFVTALLSGIDAVLVEGDEPKGWEVYSGEGFRRALEGLGFREIQPPPPGDTPPN